MPQASPDQASLTKKLLQWSIQALLAGAVAGLLIWMGHNVLVHMRARGIQAGFGFLSEPAGFDIGESFLEDVATRPIWLAFVVGLVNTVRVSIPAIILGTLLGTLLGIGRLSRFAVPRTVATIVVQTIRNIPLLLQLLLCYFALTSLLPGIDHAWHPLPGVMLSQSGLYLPIWHCDQVCGWETPHVEGFGVEGGLALTPEFTAVFLSLTLYAGVFIAEIVRGGIQSVERGKIDAARALGMTRRQVLRHVIFPLALRAIIPALTNQYLNLVKNSSLAVAVGYPDLVSVANTSLNQSGRAFECIVIVMLTYLLLSLITAAIMNLYNARVALRGNR